ncbi:MAG: BREX-3 system P-loop-containing protein BrxF [Candidatus Ruthia sp.]|jgi:hypothetical protein|nr:BREX-3 system P-loop-containing protein BrxF [Candidatus Ruthturnera sp.]
MLTNLNDALESNIPMVFITEGEVDNVALSVFEKINLNKMVSSQLVDVPSKEYSRVVPGIIEHMLTGINKSIVLIEGIEILFDRSLAIDPVRLLRKCSLNKKLIVLWPGRQAATGLIYAVPNHPEYRTYKKSDLTEIIFLENTV